MAEIAASNLREVMSDAVLQEAPSQDARRVALPPCTSAIHALLDLNIAHDAAHNFLVKRLCCRFAQVIGITSDPGTTFPYLLKTRASSLELCAVPDGSIARRQRRHPDQSIVEPAAPAAPH
jgi:hypothetical protein